MARRKHGGKLRGYSGFNLAIGPSYKIGWSREEHPTLEPEHECTNCKRKGACYKWRLNREIFAFGKVITQHMEVMECQYCLNEFVIGSLDFKPKGEKKRKINIRKWSPEQRRKLMEVIEREIREGRIK